jgi:hypothetical protein
MPYFKMGCKCCCPDPCSIYESDLKKSKVDNGNNSRSLDGPPSSRSSTKGFPSSSSKSLSPPSTISKGIAFDPDYSDPESIFTKNTLYEEEIDTKDSGAGSSLLESPGDVDNSTEILTQYTPEYRTGGVGGADSIRDQIVRSNNVSAGTQRHDPNGISWISTDKWNAAVWDGIPINPTTMSTSQLCSWMFPNPNTMRGLRERYYTVNPFTDLRNPTIAEVDAWNIEIIKHFRALLGITTPISPDRCLYLRAQWATERKFSTAWDTAYPGTFNSSYGPCYNGTNSHCGGTFIPSPTDQVPYLNGLTSCSSTAGSEGVINVNSDLPWSIKLTRIIAYWLCSEGLGGHTGPFIARTKVGMAWHVAGASTVFRVKWGG